MRPPFNINPSAIPTVATRKALLILDLQNDFLSPDGALNVPEPEGYVERTLSLAKAFRDSAAGDVIWVRSEFERSCSLLEEEDQIVTADVLTRPKKGGAPTRGRQPTSSTHEMAAMEDDDEAFLSVGTDKDSKTCVRKGTPGADFTPEVRAAIVAGRDIVFTKTHYSAFAPGQQQLVQLLRGRFVTQMYICGALTNISIYATALGAGQHGYEVTLVEDCCGFRSAMRHLNAVRQLNHLTGCDALSSEALLEDLQPPSPPPPPTVGGSSRTTGLSPFLSKVSLSSSGGGGRGGRGSLGTAASPAPGPPPPPIIPRDDASPQRGNRGATSTVTPRTPPPPRRAATNVGGIRPDEAAAPEPARPSPDADPLEADPDDDPSPSTIESIESIESSLRRAVTAKREEIKRNNAHRSAAQRSELESPKGPQTLSPALSPGPASPKAEKPPRVINRVRQRVQRPPAENKKPPSTTASSPSSEGLVVRTRAKAEPARAAEAKAESKAPLVTTLPEPLVAAETIKPGIKPTPPSPAPPPPPPLPQQPLTTSSSSPPPPPITPASPSPASPASLEPSPPPKMADPQPQPEHTPVVSPPLCEGDTAIITNILPPALAADAFDRLLAEVSWAGMSHMGGEVPRRIAVQGAVAADGSMPVYRHPADESPPLLPFSPTVARIKAEVERQLGHEVNHVLIQHYRTGGDYISEHSDKTLDIAKGSFIANVSLGAERTMVLRTKRAPREGKGAGEEAAASKEEPATTKEEESTKEKESTTKQESPTTNEEDPPAAKADSATKSPSPSPASPAPTRQTTRIPLPHNSLLRMGLATNQHWLHAIRPDKRADRDKTAPELSHRGARISLTFRLISTFIDAAQSHIWGQGAVSKTREGAGEVVNGQGEEAVRLLRAFGAENNMAGGFEWDGWYGKGYDVLHMGSPKRWFARAGAGGGAGVESLAVGIALGEMGVGCAKGSVEGREVRFEDNDVGRAVVEGGGSVLRYLDAVYGAGRRYDQMLPGEVARRFGRLQRGLDLAGIWAGVVGEQKGEIGKKMGKELEVWEGWAKEAAEAAAAEAGKKDGGDESDGSGNFYIGGTSQPSPADFAAWPVLHEMVKMCGEELLGENLRRYYTAFGARSSVAKALGVSKGNGD